MKTVGEVIRRAPVWVNPDHTAESAIILMRGHDIGALPVLDGRQLVGMVHCSQLLGADPSRRVGDVMTTDVPSLTPETMVREAADVMARASLSRLPVLQEGRLVGVLSVADLLPELGRSYDPLTNLPWTDSLRDWALDRFRDGREITILFFDVDDFGAFNKRYGHVVGDEVLQSVAGALAAGIEPDCEVLCRYGGDEFCIATLRPSDEAVRLAASLQQRIAEIRIPAVGDQHVTCCVGQHGGKRTREREHVHYAATLNNLINLASRDCTARKKGSSCTDAPPEPLVKRIPVERTPRLQLDRVAVKRRGRLATAYIDLLLGAHARAETEGQSILRLEGLTRYSATSSEEVEEGGTVPLVARTTAAALRTALPDGYDVTLTDVLLSQTAEGQALITVVGLFVHPGAPVQIAGSAVVGTDRYRAAASSVLAAVNRQIGLLLARPVS